MKTDITIFAGLTVISCCAFAQGDLSFKADRIAVDNVTRAAVATGHVEAVSGVVTLRGELLERDVDGVIRFDSSTSATTCTNAVDHTHWNVSGAVEYKANDYVILRNAWLEFYEVPVLYLPYLWYPLDTKCGFSWMPGWMGRWGAYLMTRYSYNLLGDPLHGESTYWLKGATRFDIREKQGIALGEDLDWNLDGFGRGHFKVYYAWDKSDDYDERGIYRNRYNYHNWGSTVPDERYSIELAHNWHPTERDTVRIKGSYFSDSYFRNDFFRSSIFTLANPFLGYDGNEVAWEHFETGWGVGISVSGPLNDFCGGTSRLPEIYLDINPAPIGELPINYESQSRIGYLKREAAEMGKNRSPFYPYAYDPGPWADYEAFRFDTYHRLTAPFKMADDVLSVVPRLALRGTYWNHCGGTDLTGFNVLDIGRPDGGDMSRLIPEAGVTFAARGTGWVDESWRHLIEPYVDVLAQDASYSGASGARRPYVFDNLDASVMWEDQFAGRVRNLPYTYYGVTPGIRQSWDRLDADGRLRTVLEVDVYAALQFNSADRYDSMVPYPHNRHLHTLAEAGSPNYGENDIMVVPGARIKWTPDRDITLFFGGEYDSEHNKLALADLAFDHLVAENFKYYAKYNLRDYRWWDFSSTPFNEIAYSDHCRMMSDDFNRAYFHMADIGFEYQPLDWFRCSPFIRWDLNEGELDRVGCWFEYLVDCLGFRLILTYENEYIMLDGYERESDFNVGFVIYLRAMGDGATNIFMH